MPCMLDGWKVEVGTVTGGFVIKSTPPTKFDFSHGLPTFVCLDPGVIEAGYPQRFLAREDGSFWIAVKQVANLQKKPDRFRGLVIAPAGTKWKDTTDAILVDVPMP